LGLQHSNRDFSDESSWGKNEFNNAFPVAVACYMGAQNIDPVYINLNENGTCAQRSLGINSLFGGDPQKGEVHFAFEQVFAPHQVLLADDASLPTNDVVVSRREAGVWRPHRPLEIKLTALPDAITAKRKEAAWGSELVIRQPTVASLGLQLIEKFEDHPQEAADLCLAFNGVNKTDWTKLIRNHTAQRKLQRLATALHTLLVSLHGHEEPLVMQPIWKTNGVSSELADDFLDMFIWSDLAFAQMIIERSLSSPLFRGTHLSRPSRSMVWLAAMLEEYGQTGAVAPHAVISRNLAGAKTDKAIAINGSLTNPYMACAQLTKPRVKLACVRSIILGQGEAFLQPERRLDAAIVSNLSRIF